MLSVTNPGYTYDAVVVLPTWSKPLTPVENTTPTTIRGAFIISCPIWCRFVQKQHTELILISNETINSIHQPKNENY